jgi:preprotein translocase subunit SecA
MIREDFGDLVFKTEDGKFNAVVREIEEMRQIGRPVLVGTTSVEKSERLSGMLQRRGIQHQVLNAKQHEKEAAVVALAGEESAVTIATNMAGRGTDIKLGPGVKERGGLHIVGTERHESRRIDNQLRGRSGRQGDPGSSRFYVSLEDELMLRFGSQRITGVMGRLGLDDDNPIEHRLISKSIESAQTKVEGHNFDTRKHVVQYDDVMNRHREVIYRDRARIVDGDDMSDKVAEMIGGEIEKVVDAHLPERPSKDVQPNFEALVAAYLALIPNGKIDMRDIQGKDRDEVMELLDEDAGRAYAEVEERFTAQSIDMRMIERRILLSVIDKLWVEHLTAMDALREGVGLQAYGQRDPLVVYKTEGFRMFGLLQDHIQHDLVHTIFRIQPVVAQQPVHTRLSESANLVTNRDESANGPRRAQKLPGRNEPCWCGSGKKFKRCHGAVPSKTTV